MPEQGKIRVLIIGINYKNSEFDELLFAENDANAIKEVLLRQDIKVVEEGDIETLVGNPDSNDLRLSLGKILKKAENEDTILIYFAGHGKLDDYNSLCLATRETQKNMIRETSIPLDYIVLEIKKRNCKNSVLILDSCYSGVEEEDATRGVEEDLPDGSFGQIQGQGMVIISASKKFQKAKERNDLGHGVFTHYLVKGLRDGEADDGNNPYVSIEMLYNYAKSKVKEETGGKQEPDKWPPKNGGTEVYIAKSIKNQEKKEIEKTGREFKIDKIHNLYDTGELSGLICSKAIRILEKSFSDLSDREKKYDKYIEDFLSGIGDIAFFIRCWNRMEKSEQAEGERPQTQANQTPQGITLQASNVKEQKEQKDEGSTKARTDRTQRDDRGVEVNSKSTQADVSKKQDSEPIKPPPEVLGGDTRVSAEPTLKSEPVVKPEKEIFVSYAWGGEREEIVNQLDKALQEKGIKIIRDKRDLGFKGLIKEFMERIGRGKCVIVVISEKYLKSENCMFELVQVAKNGEFYDRVFPIVLADAKIYKSVDRADYVMYWQEETKKLNEKIKSFDSVANIPGLQKDIDLYTEIRNTIDRLTDILRDMNTLTPEIHGKSSFEELFKAIESKMAE